MSGNADADEQTYFSSVKTFVWKLWNSAY